MHIKVGDNDCMHFDEESVFTIRRWYHFFIQIGSDTVKIYNNEKEEYYDLDCDHPGAFNKSAKYRISIGKHSTDSKYHISYGGRIADLRFYPSYLTKTELKQIGKFQTIPGVNVYTLDDPDFSGDGVLQRKIDSDVITRHYNDKSMIFFTSEGNYVDAVLKCKSVGFEMIDDITEDFNCIK